jgi:hypothetical protein
MKTTKISAALATAIIALGMFGAESASATFLEIKGMTREGETSVTATLEGSTLLTSTAGAFQNKCSGSHLAATITGFAISAFGPVSSFTFSSCTHEKVVVDKAGSLSLQYIGTSTNGTVRSTGANLTVPVPNGFGGTTTVTCTTSETDIGTLTGVASGKARLDVNAVLSCGGILPTAKWNGTYTVTSPEGLGVTM